MGIDFICIPPEFGQPYLYVDWDHNYNNSISGRRFVIGFTDLDTPSAVSVGAIIYSTYNFQMGEFTYSDTDFKATIDDFYNLKNKSYLIEINGVTGYVNYSHRDYSFASEAIIEIQKEVIFPFKDYYIAIVYKLSGNYSYNPRQILNNLYKNKYPEKIDQLINNFKPTYYEGGDKKGLQLIDNLISSLVFKVGQ